MTAMGKSTRMTTEALLRAHLLPAFGSRLLSEIRREELQTLLDRTAGNFDPYSGWPWGMVP